MVTGDPIEPVCLARNMRGTTEFACRYHWQSTGNDLQGINGRVLTPAWVATLSVTLRGKPGKHILRVGGNRQVPVPSHEEPVFAFVPHMFAGEESILTGERQLPETGTGTFSAWGMKDWVLSAEPRNLSILCMMSVDPDLS